MSFNLEPVFEAVVKAIRRKVMEEEFEGHKKNMENCVAVLTWSIIICFIISVCITSNLDGRIRHLEEQLKEFSIPKGTNPMPDTEKKFIVPAPTSDLLVVTETDAFRLSAVESFSFDGAFLVTVHFPSGRFVKLDRDQSMMIYDHLSQKGN